MDCRVIDWVVTNRPETLCCTIKTETLCFQLLEVREIFAAYRVVIADFFFQQLTISYLFIFIALRIYRNIKKSNQPHFAKITGILIYYNVVSIKTAIISFNSGFKVDG